MYTHTEAQKVLKNPATKQLVEWVNSQSKITKMLMSPQFFHKSHSLRDRQVICIMLQNFYPGITIKRSGNDGVLITF